MLRLRALVLRNDVTSTTEVSSSTTEESLPTNQPDNADTPAAPTELDNMAAAATMAPLPPDGTPSDATAAAGADVGGNVGYSSPQSTAIGGLCPALQCRFDFQQISSPSPTPLASIEFNTVKNTVYFTTSGGCSQTVTTLTYPLTYAVYTNLKNNVGSAVASASEYASTQLSSLISGCSAYTDIDGLPSWVSKQQSVLDADIAKLIITSTTTRPSSRPPTISSSVTSTAQAVPTGGAGEIASGGNKPQQSSTITIALAAILTFVICFAGLLGCAWWERRRWQRKRWSLEAQASEIRRNKRRRRRPRVRAIADQGTQMSQQVSRAGSKNRRLLSWLQGLEGKFREGAKSSSGRSVATERHELPGDSSYSGKETIPRPGTSHTHKKGGSPDTHELNGAETAHQMPVSADER